MKLLQSVFISLCAIVALCSATKDCTNIKRINSKLICYYSKLTEVDSCYCTHVVLPADADLKQLESLRQKLNGVKILLTVNDFHQGLVKSVKQNHIDGLELNLKKLSSKNDISEFIATVRSKLGSDLLLALSVPSKTELLAKYYDFKALTKSTDLFILQTAFLGASKNVTFHPSRLSGLWDMQNTDSVVDLVSGLGAPVSRLVVSAPVQAFRFQLQDSSLTTPGSPALKLASITRSELCKTMGAGDGWTLERDQDQAGPYIFRDTEWISFEDATSMDIKAKYARVRGLAGLALKDVSQDDSECGSLLAAAHTGLARQTRAPRGAVLRSLEREILDTPIRPLDTVHVSPYRISRIVDVEGHVHDIRKDTRTEFECSRQGYFVHPHSCGRFYRCVKFDQLSDEFSVFEFACPAGLAFDERVEVCVWPGSLPDGAPCAGSSEIAPVPKNRFACPSEPGYYADPENCRWFFACLDHGKSGLTAYEFRCPFGLVFDEKRLICEWPWLVPTCSSGHLGLHLDSVEFFGGVAKSSLYHTSSAEGASAAAVGAGAGIGLGTQLHGLSVGAQILDSYDGLGELGTITLGGYNGDLNALKESLAFGYNNNGHLTHTSSDGHGGQLQGGHQSVVDGGNIAFSTTHQQSHLGSGDHLTLVDASGLNHAYSTAQQSSAGSTDFNSGLYQGQLNFEGAKLEGASFATSNANHENLNLNVGDKLASQNAGISSVQFHTSHANDYKSSGERFGAILSGEFHGANYKSGEEQITILNTGASNINHGSLHFEGQNANQDKIGVVHFGTGVQQNAGISGHSSSVQHGATSYQQTNFGKINLGEEVRLHDAHIKLGEAGAKTTSAIEYHGNSGYNYDNNNNQHESVLLNSGAKSSQSQITYHNNDYNAGHDKLVLTKYEVPQVQQQTVLIDTGAKSNQQYQFENNGATSSIHFSSNAYNGQEKLVKIDSGVHSATVHESTGNSYENSGAKSFSSSVQYHGNSGYQYGTGAVDNSAKIATSNVEYRNNNHDQKLHIIDSGIQYQTVQHAPIDHGSLNYNYQYADQAKYVQQPVSHVSSSHVGSYDKYNVDELKYNVHVPTSISYGTKQTHSSAVTATGNDVSTHNFNLYRESAARVEKLDSNPTVVKYASHYAPVTPKTDIFFGKYNAPSYSTSYHYQTPVVHLQQKLEQPATLYSSSGNVQSQFYGATAYKNPEVLVHKIETPVTAKYETHHYQKQINIPTVQIAKVETPVETISVTPKYEAHHYQQQIHYPNVQVAKVETPVETVSVTPKYEAHHYQQQIHYPNVQVSKVETPVQTVSVTPKYEAHHYQQQIHYPNVQVAKVETPVETVSVTPKYEAHHYQQQIHYPNVQVAKVETPVTQKYETHYYQQQINLPTVSKVETPVETISVTPKYESQYYQKQVQHIQPISYETHVPVVQNTAPIKTEYQYTGPTKIESTFYGKHSQESVTASSVNAYLPPRPAVKYESREYLPPKPVVNTVYVSSTPQPKLYLPPKPVEVFVSTTPKYTVFQEFIQPKQTFEIKKTVQPTVVNIQQTPAKSESHFFGQHVQHVQTQPIVESYSYLPPKPSVTNIKYESREYLPPKQIYVSSTPRPEVYVSSTPKYESREYLPPKPIVNTVYISTPKPKIYLPPKQEVFVSTTPKYAVFQDYVQPKQTFEIKKTVQPTVVSEYKYENAAFSNYESNLDFKTIHQDYYQPAQVNVELPKTETVYYSTEKPYVSSTYKAIPIKNYQTEFILSTPKPTFASTIAPVIKQSPKIQTKVVAINKYETLYDRYIVSTPKPFYISSPVVTENSDSSLGTFKYYDSRFETASQKSQQYYKESSDYSAEFNQYGNYETEFVVSTPKPEIIVSTVRPIQRKKIVASTTAVPLETYAQYDDSQFKYYDSRYETASQISSQYLKETSEFNQFGNYESEYVLSTPKPEIVSTIRPVQRKKIVSTTTAIPLETYSQYIDDQFDSQYLVTAKPEIISTYRPEIRKKIVSTTTAIPVIVSTVRPKVTTSRPVIKKKKIVTTTTAIPLESYSGFDYDEYVVSSPKSVKITPKPKTKTVVRVNDFNPFLTTKLGAQCTCVSNTLKLRKQPKESKVEEVYDYDYGLPDNVPVTKLTSSGPASYDDYNEPGVYVVSNSEASNDYDYDLKKIVAVTKTPEVVIKSTTNAVQPAPTPIYTIRKKVTTIRPQEEVYISSTPATEIVENVFIKKSSRVLGKSDKSKEEKIAEAVNEGLSLVKSAIKGYVKEAVNEETRNFDRYGPGGWRSRDETLQGSVDCKRAGLFRHPTQCNKFYACHWDCKKERYTLHVFNCPVHLTFDSTQGACNWPSKGPSCTDNTLLPSA